jgi:3-phosphoshikimate 1-carboxyvinyltransferase
LVFGIFLEFGIWNLEFNAVLPDLIEIVPLTAPVRAEITVPGSKSITNRALVLAALADGEVTLEGALWSEDTQVMVDCLQRLGFEVRVEPDPNEFCNRTITVRGRGGEIPNAGTVEKPLELFVGNAGTAARFLSAMVCLGRGVYRLSGVPRMHERPQAALFQALRELGYRVDSANDKLPATIHGGSSRGDETLTEKEKQGLLTSSATGKKKATVSIEESSQFASALLLCAERGGWEIEVVGENAEESPYVAMTKHLSAGFPKFGGSFQIEPDASSGSYFVALDWLLWIRGKPNKNMGQITVRHWPKSGWQIDADYPKYLIELPVFLSRKLHLGDSIMTAIVKAPFNRPPVVQQFVYPSSIIRGETDRPIVFTNLGRLRLQETERVTALKNELKKCGARILEVDDSLAVFPSQLHGAEIETYNDHRMAMCFAVLGLKVPGIKLRNPSCVKKTFPNFFQKLAAAPPHGLGVTILDGHTGRKLSHDELFAL